MWKWLCILCVAFSSTVMSAETKVLAFSGSTRDGSVNRKLVTETANMAHQMGADVTVLDIRDYQLPFFDEDLEAKEGIPTKGRQLRQLMSQSQIIFIASPEYNGSLSAVLKNIIDWASRDDENGKPSTSFKGKKFVIMSASPGSRGGVRGLAHLREILGNVGGTVVGQQFELPDAYSAFDAQGHLKDPKKKQELQNLVQSVIKVEEPVSK